MTPLVTAVPAHPTPLPADDPVPTVPAGGGLSLRAYTDFLPQPGGRRIAVLAPADLGKELTTLLAELADDDVYVLAAAEAPRWKLATTGATLLEAATVPELHAQLRRVGPVDLVVDLLPAATPGEQDVWRSLFFHLREGGVYALANRRATKGKDRSPGRVDLLTHRPWLGPAPAASRVDADLVDSCGRFRYDQTYLLVEKLQQHLLKLRDREVPQLLQQRNTGDTATVLATLESGELACRGEVVSHGSAVPITNLAELMAYPELHVHHNQGRLHLVRNSLLYGESEVLPGSFRYPLTKNLGNPRLIDVTPDFARVPAELRSSQTLEGVFYHLDCWNPEHFGHVITEVVSRLWGWPAAKTRFPDLKAIFRRREPDGPFPELEVTLFTAFGIDRSDIVWVTEPVALESVVTATSMWQNGPPYYVHPEIEQTWRRLRQGLVRRRPDGPKRIFVSRRPTLKNRACRNIADVEQVFTRHGFTVVFPEELSLAEQASVFGGAEVVAGFAGSGLYNVLYCEGLTTLVVLSQEAYTARYEHLYTMVLGCTTHYFWSTPDVPHPLGGWSEEAYYSSWEFDFGRNGPELEDTLAGLAS